MDAEPESDSELLARASGGDGGAFSELLNRQYRHVSGYFHSRDPFIRPSDLEDLTQEVFARAWRVRHKYRGQASVRTFLFAVARNVLSEHWRRSRRSRESRRDVEVFTRQELDSPTELRELLAIVGDAYGQLTGKQREAFRLVLINEVPVAEVAQQARTSVKAIRRRAETARDLLRRKLTACGSQCSYDCPSLKSCPAETGETSCLKFLIRKYL